MLLLGDYIRLVGSLTAQKKCSEKFKFVDVNLSTFSKPFKYNIKTRYVPKFEVFHII